MPESPPALTPESIVAEITDDLTTAINQGVPRWKRTIVTTFAPRVVAYAIGLLILKTAAWAYPVLMFLEPFAIAYLLPLVARWITAIRVLYASRITIVAGVNLATIAGHPVTFVSIFKPGVDPSQVHRMLAMGAEASES